MNLIRFGNTPKVLAFAQAHTETLARIEQDGILAESAKLLESGKLREVAIPSNTAPKFDLSLGDLLQAVATGNNGPRDSASDKTLAGEIWKDATTKSAERLLPLFRILESLRLVQLRETPWGEMDGSGGTDTHATLTSLGKHLVSVYA